MQVFPCPFCKKEIQVGVDICVWCETTLATGLVQSKGGAAPYTGDQIVGLVDALEAWRNSDEEDPKDPSRPFNRHWLALGVPAAIFILGRLAAPGASLLPLLLALTACLAAQEADKRTDHSAPSEFSKTDLARFEKFTVLRGKPRIPEALDILEVLREATGHDCLVRYERVNGWSRIA